MTTLSETVDALIDSLRIDVPEVFWTRRALYPVQVVNWPTGCVVVESLTARGEPLAERIWDLALRLRVYAKADGTGNADMLNMCERLTGLLDNAEIDGAAHVQVMSADIDQDELDTKQCMLDVVITLTV